MFESSKLIVPISVYTDELSFPASGLAATYDQWLFSDGSQVDRKRAILPAVGELPRVVVEAYHMYDPDGTRVAYPETVRQRERAIQIGALLDVAQQSPELLRSYLF